MYILTRSWCSILEMTANDELKELMATVPLTQAEIAEYTESSIDTVRGWCSAIDAVRYRNMPKNRLKLLKISLCGKI